MMIFNKISNYIQYRKLTSIALSFLFFYVQTSQAQNMPSNENSPTSIEKTEDQSNSLFLLNSTDQNTHYSGSQATDMQASLKEEVNEKTGDVNLKYPLVDIKVTGLNFNFSLNLNYNTASSQSPGGNSLPSGWNFDLPFLDLTNSTKAIVRFNGVSYTEDPLWSDATMYHSGLRYVNTHGVKFQRFSNQQMVQLDHQTTIYYKFLLKFVDGSKVYFDGYGRPLAKTNRFNVYILYKYFDQGNFYNSRISEISNSLYKNQKISFFYMGNSIAIQNPNGSTTKLLVTGDKLARIENALGEQIAFQYNNTSPSSANLVTSINYPNGLNTVFKYAQLQIGACGALGSKSAVSEVMHLDSSQNNVVLNDTLYKYNPSTNNNYSGFPYIYSCPKSEQDLLMESNNFSFLYDVSVTKVGMVKNISENGKSFSDKQIATTTKTSYNFLHLPVRIENYTSKFGVSTPLFVTEFKYNLTRDIHKMNPAFSFPISKTVSVFDSISNSYKPYSYSEYITDSYGNNTSTIEFKYVIGEQKWLPVSKKLVEYYHDTDSDYYLLKKEDNIDFVTNTIYENQFFRSADKKEISTKLVGTLNSQGAFVPSISYSYNFDEFGRKIFEKMGCLDSSEGMCQGNVKEISTTTAYNYNEFQNILQVVSTDAANQVWIKTIDSSIGKELSSISPSGKVIESKTYDAIGRVVTEKTPGLHESDFNTKTFSYKSFQKDSVNEVTEKTDNNYALTKVYDALDREIKKFDNFFPELENSGKSIAPENVRLLSFVEYNTYGEIDSETNQFGQKTYTSYDEYARKIGTIDPFLNVKETKIDDANRTETTFLNGTKISQAIKDTQGNIISTTVFPYESYLCRSSYCENISSTNFSKKVQKSEFDAQNREIKKEELFYNSEGTLLNTSSFEMNYNLLGKVYRSVFTGYDGISTVRAQNYDLYGNVVSFTKQRSENGKLIPLFTSDVYSYNSLSQLIKIIRQDGKEELYSYNMDGQLIQKVSYSGVAHNYDYYANNKLKLEKISGQSISVALSNVANMALNAKNKFKYYLNFMFGYSTSSNEASVSSSVSPDWQREFNNASRFNEINYNYNKDNSLINVSYSINGVPDLSRNIFYNYLADGLTVNAIHYPSGKSQTTTYDRYGRVLTTKDVSGNVLTYTYDSQANHSERLRSVGSEKNKQ